MGRYDNNLALWQRAQGILPSGAQTLSKSPARYPPAYPKYITRGQGCRVWDPDGNCYSDYVSALGPIILGYNHQKVTEAVVRQVQDGISFSFDHPLTIDVAEKLIDLIPSAEAVRFVKTGSDAVMAAVRLARTYTGREVVAVASNSYHGQHDWLQVKEELGKNGVPRCLSDRIVQFEYNSLNSVALMMALHGAEIAAVVVEPARDFYATREFLAGVNELCRHYGVVSIWDEVVTFGRYPGLSYQAHIGVVPDITALGKAMANGAALGAICGNRAIMAAFERCFISGTYSGETVGLAAASATLDILRSEPVVEHIWRQGKRLQDTFNEYAAIWGLPVRAKGVPCCMRQTWDTGDAAQDKILQDLWLQETARLGQLFGSIQYPNYSHTDEVLDETLSAVGDALAVVEKAWRSGDPERYLEGEGASLSG